MYVLFGGIWMRIRIQIPPKSLQWREKKENLSPHLNTQYFAAASIEFQFPSPGVKTWIINDDVFGRSL